MPTHGRWNTYGLLDNDKTWLDIKTCMEYRHTLPLFVPVVGPFCHENCMAFSFILNSINVVSIIPLDNNNITYLNCKSIYISIKCAYREPAWIESQSLCTLCL